MRFFKRTHTKKVGGQYISTDSKPSSKPTPNFLIIGANKAGTTSLYHYLSCHPEIFMSKIKEPNYFKHTPFDPEYLKKWCNGAKNKEQLLDFMLEGYNGERMFGEASTAYSGQNSNHLAEYIYKSHPNMKFIYIIRNPIGRIVSRYLYLLSIGKIKEDFNTSLQDIETFLTHSLYYKQISHYLKYFDQTRIKVVIFEEFTKDPKITLSQIFEFLEVKKINIDPNLLKKYNKSVNRKKYKSNELKFTRENYDRMANPIIKDIAQMEKLINKPLSKIWDVSDDKWIC